MIALRASSPADRGRNNHERKGRGISETRLSRIICSGHVAEAAKRDYHNMFLLISWLLDSTASNFIHFLAVYGIDSDNRIDVFALRVRLALCQAGVRHADVQLGMHRQDSGICVLDGFP